jgi:hypothetical protein
MTRTEDALIDLIPVRPAQPSVITIAKKVLDQNLSIGTQGRYLLWRNGRWNAVNLDDVMRATNRRLKDSGRPQILLNPAWEAL